MNVHYVLYVVYSTYIWMKIRQVICNNDSEDSDNDSTDKEQKYKEVFSNSTYNPDYRYSETEDTFETDDMEFMLYGLFMNYTEAVKYCKRNYNGRLMLVKTEDLADFVAITLGETNLIKSSIWIGGRTKNNSSREFFWYDGNRMVERLDQAVDALVDSNSKDVFETIFNLIDTREESRRQFYKKLYKSIKNKNVESGKNCLSIDSVYLNVPRLVADNCSKKKAILCERDKLYQSNARVSQTKIVNYVSTHYGWIKVKNKYFKIYAQQVTWEDAKRNCINQGAKLAIVSNYEETQALTKYLMVGRPCLRNAWIGAKYEKNRFVFVDTNQVLPNTTNFEHYPPWRNGSVQIKRGCLLLDHQMSAHGVFIEACCLRRRSFICMSEKPNGNLDKPDKTGYIIKSRQKINDKFDVIIDAYGYRVYLTPKTWRDAKRTCNSFERRYNGKLLMIRTKTTMRHVLFAMGEGKLPIRHIWIGGVYNESWNWINGDPINETDEKLLNWFRNSTTQLDIEMNHKCLNIDRRNHNQVLCYGTRCNWKQPFMCQFDRNKLKQLRKSEQDQKGVF